MLARNKNDQIEVFIHDGRIVFAESGKARAEKALYRAFEWHKGEFKTEPFPAELEPIYAECAPLYERLLEHLI